MEEKTPVQMAVDAMNARGEPPRRLNIDPTSPDFDKRYIDIGVRFNSVVRKGDVVAYDAEQGWIRIHLRDRMGKPKRERGVFVTMTLKGKVEPFWKDQPALI
jgi:hypothetical protein